MKHTAKPPKTTAEVTTLLLRIIHQVTGIEHDHGQHCTTPEISSLEHLKLDSLGVDSLHALSIVEQLSLHLDCQISSSALFAYPTLGELVAHLIECAAPTNNDQTDLPTALSIQQQPLGLFFAANAMRLLSAKAEILKVENEETAPLLGYWQHIQVIENVSKSTHPQNNHNNPSANITTYIASLNEALGFAWQQLQASQNQPVQTCQLISIHWQQQWLCLIRLPELFKWQAITQKKLKADAILYSLHAINTDSPNTQNAVSSLEQAIHCLHHGVLPDKKNTQHFVPWQCPPKQRELFCYLDTSEHYLLKLAHHKSLLTQKQKAHNKQALTLNTQDVHAQKASATTSAPPEFMWHSDTPQTTDDTAQTTTMCVSQQNLCLLQLAQPASYALNIPINIPLLKTKCPTANTLQQAFEYVVQQYPILRSRFCLQTTADTSSIDNALQTLFDVQYWPLSAFQLQEQPCKTSDLDMLDHVQQTLLEQAFDLQNSPLVRGYYWDFDEHWLLLLLIHHSVIDGFSAPSLISSIEHALEDILEKTFDAETITPDLSAWQYAQRQQQYLRSESAQRDRDYWRQRLHQVNPHITLPYATPNITNNNTSHSVEHYLSSQESANIEQHAQALGLSLPSYYLSAFHVFLWMLSDQEDIAIATVNHGRPHACFQHSVGCFINVVVSRAQLAPSDAINHTLQRLNTDYLTSLRHAQLPFSEVQKLCGFQPKRLNDAVIDVSFAYQRFFQTLSAHHAHWTTQGIQQATQDPYALEVLEISNKTDNSTQIQLRFKAQAHRITQAQLTTHATAFTGLLKQLSNLTATDQKTLHQLTLITPERAILHGETDHHALAPRLSILDHLAYRANHKIEAEQIAVNDAVTTLTYRALWALSEHIAEQLLAVLFSDRFNKHLANLDTPTSVAIGLYAPREAYSIAAMVAIWRIGAYYVPIVPDTPQARLQSMLADCNAPIVLQHHAYDALNLSGSNTSLLPFTTTFDTYSEQKNQDKTRRLTALNALRKHREPYIAYCLFTSGSTGKPKGVLVPFSAVTHYATQYVKRFCISADDRILQGAHLGFDISVEEIVPALIAGAQIHILQEGYQDILAAIQRIKTEKITVVSTVPAVCARLNEADHLPSLRLVISGGDRLYYSQVDQLVKHSHSCQVMNTYGPTEACICATYQPVTANDTPETHANIPIGSPIANTRLMVADRYGRPLLADMIGELYISGPGLAIGYQQQDELNATHFTQRYQHRWYKSGDRVRYDTQGRITFLGRNDTQFSVQGYRIEAGDIQQQLVAHSAIVDVQVLTSCNTTDNQHPIVNLIAAVILTPLDAAQKAPMLLDALHTLPAYMRPQLVSIVETFPLTPNGKLDTQALRQQAIPVHRLSAPTQPCKHQAPKIDAAVVQDTALLTKVTQLWRTCFNSQTLQIEDNFFASGGHSILAMQLSLQLTNALARNISINTIYQHPSILQLCTYIQHSQDAQPTETHQSLAAFRQDAPAWRC